MNNNTKDLLKSGLVTLVVDILVNLIWHITPGENLILIFIMLWMFLGEYRRIGEISKNKSKLHF